VQGVSGDEKRPEMGGFGEMHGGFPRLDESGHEIERIGVSHRNEMSDSCVPDGYRGSSGAAILLNCGRPGLIGS
jgi:hypothetical protein